MPVNERDIEYSIDIQLTKLGWTIDHKDKKRNVYKQQPRTEQEKKLLNKKKPDYILYSKTDSNKSTVIIEAKKPNEPLNKALEQAKDYASKLNTPIVIASDGYRLKTWHMKFNQPLFNDEKEVEDLFDIEKANSFISNNIYKSYKGAEDVKQNDLIKKFKEANNILKNEGLSAGIERFSEFANLMFLKMQMESGNDIAGYEWKDLEEKRGNALLASIKNIFRSLRKEHGSLFSQTKIKSKKRMEQLISILSSFHLTSIKYDVKGVAFEHFIHSYTKGLKNDLGQYFTPRHIVRTIVNLIKPKIGETVYDPFCGTGGMLIESFKYIDQNISDKKDKSYLKKKTIFGTDNSGVSKIAMMNMIMFGDGHSNLLQADSYSRFEETRNKFDVVITNIPFSQKTEFTDNYFVIPSSKEKNGDSIGLQHCLNALSKKKNSRAAIIVPISVLHIDALENEREYIINNFFVETIIELTPKCFNPYTETQTAILIIKNKNGTAKNLTKYYKIENDGYSQNAYRIPTFGENDLDKTIDQVGYDEIDLQKRSDVNFRFKHIYQICKKDEFPLHTFAEVKRGDQIAPNTNPLYVAGGKHKLMMVSDLAERHIDYYLNDSKIKINNLALDDNNPFLFAKNTIIVPTSGKASLLNHRALLAEESYLIQHLTGITSNNKIHPYCLFYFFLNFNIEEIVYDLGYPAIEPNLLKNIPVPNYDDKKQQEIVRRVEELVEHEKNLKNKHKIITQKNL